MKPDGSPIVLRQVLEGTLHRLALLPVRGTWALDLGPLKRRRLLARAAACFLAKLVPAGTDDRTHDPGFHGSFSPELPCQAKDAQESDLHGILCVGTGGEVTQCQAIGGIGMSSKQTAQCRTVALLRKAAQVGQVFGVFVSGDRGHGWTARQGRVRTTDFRRFDEHPGYRISAGMGHIITATARQACASVLYLHLPRSRALRRKIK